MKKISKLFGLAIVLSGAMVSCSSPEGDNDLGEPNKLDDLGEPKMVVNMLPDPQPIQLAPEQRMFVNDNNQFTLKFLKTVNEADQSGKSFIYSPLSITYVLGMVNDAAEGETEKELEKTLGFHEGGIQAVNDYCKKLIDGLPKVDKNVELNIANAIFLNKEFTLKEQFQKDMATLELAKDNQMKELLKEYDTPADLSVKYVEVITKKSKLGHHKRELIGTFFGVPSFSLI